LGILKTLLDKSKSERNTNQTKSTHSYGSCCWSAWSLCNPGYCYKEGFM